MTGQLTYTNLKIADERIRTGTETCILKREQSLLVDISQFRLLLIGGDSYESLFDILTRDLFQMFDESMVFYNRKKRTLLSDTNSISL